MMNCREFQKLYEAWIAGTADDTADRALEEHANACVYCQAYLNTEESVSAKGDESMRSALAEPQAAARVAERVIDQLASPQLLARLPSKQSNLLTAWLIPLLTMVAGFLLAMLVLPRIEKKADPVSLRIAQPAPTPPPVAHFVAATGPVELFDNQQQGWKSIEPNKIKYMLCPSDTRLRTAADVRCELQTGDGCVIRLNDQTEVTLRGSSSIELAQGQVWCRSPGETKLEVRVTSIGDIIEKPKGEQPSLWCVGPSCVMTGIQPAGRVQVMNSEGEINLRTAHGEQRLDPGQVAEISNGEILKPTNRVDPLLSTRWMQPLLVQRGPDDAELKQRVDTLLAQIGHSKIASLYEQEIRSLGEHAVLPLVRFIQSPMAETDPARRSAAMTLTADLAPVWLIPDLIDLLEHTDPYVRRQAAATLHRLTALEMNLSPDKWRQEPDEAQAAALLEWRNWWAAHREQYPTPQLQITRE